MQWSDEGIVLGGRKFGESGLILDVLTESKGRQSGLVYGGASRRKRGQYEPGTSVSLAWSGRLEGQLGRFDTAEATRERAARLLDAADALLALSAITALLRGVLDEGDPGGSAIYAPTLALLDCLEVSDVWPAVYARWEFGLLSALGFGLDVDRCAVSGANDGLTHVSPKTGRAVRGSEAEEYLDRLFPLPAFLIVQGETPTQGDISDSLHLTGHFLDQRMFAAIHKPMPDARLRLAKRLSGR